MSKPFFSIIICAYNTEKWLGECLRSVDAQSYSNYEIVIIDDGSTDGTPEIIDEWCKYNSNSSCFHKKNEGLLLARRDGINHCKGDYILFLDADDCFKPDCLELCANVIIEQNPDIVLFDLYRGFVFKSSDNIHTNIKYEHIDIYSYKRMVVSGAVNNMVLKAVRRSLLLQDGYNYRSLCPGLMHGEDWLQTLNIANLAKTVIHIEKQLYFYRRNPYSSTGGFRESQLKDICFVLAEVFSAAKCWSDDYIGIAKDAAADHLSCLGFSLGLCDMTTIRANLPQLREKAFLFLGNGFWPYRNLRIDHAVVLASIRSGSSRVLSTVSKLQNVLRFVVRD